VAHPCAGQPWSTVLRCGGALLCLRPVPEFIQVGLRAVDLVGDEIEFGRERMAANIAKSHRLPGVVDAEGRLPVLKQPPCRLFLLRASAFVEQSANSMCNLIWGRAAEGTRWRSVRASGFRGAASPRPSLD
jgi:hypothetical protein